MSDPIMTGNTRHLVEMFNLGRVSALTVAACVPELCDEIDRLRLENTALRQSVEAVYEANRSQATSVRSLLADLNARTSRRDEALQLAEQYRRVAVAAARWRTAGGHTCGDPGCGCTECKLWSAVESARSAGLLTDDEIKEQA